MNGIDVSEHNGAIDWQKVRAAGIDFAILRAGYGRLASQKDDRFEKNYAGAKAAGIPVGAYWYSYAKTIAEAKQEALVCVECLKGKQFEYPIYYDVEEDATFKTGITNVSAMADAFCTELENAGYFAGIYAAKSHLENYFTDSVKNRYTVWVAHVGVNKTNYNGRYDMWQYSWKGKIRGINCDVDLDCCYRDFPEEIKEAWENGYTNEEPETALPYISNMTASECQRYLRWCAAKGAGQYEDTEAGFRRFINETYGGN